LGVAATAVAPRTLEAAVYDPDGRHAVPQPTTFNAKTNARPSAMRHEQRPSGIRVASRGNGPMPHDEERNPAILMITALVRIEGDDSLTPLLQRFLSIW
jgi:hypothetical protein